jgi:hypothetical protein
MGGLYLAFGPVECHGQLMNVSPQAGFVPGAVATSQQTPPHPSLHNHTLTNSIITQQPNRASVSVEVTLASLQYMDG